MDKSNLTTENTGHLSISGASTFTMPTPKPTVDFEVAETPVTDRDYMLFLRAWADATTGSGGVTFHASDPAVIAKLDANPLLRRTQAQEE